MVDEYWLWQANDFFLFFSLTLHYDAANLWSAYAATDWTGPFSFIMGKIRTKKKKRISFIISLQTLLDQEHDMIGAISASTKY